jgi:hypothetical protein
MDFMMTSEEGTASKGALRRKEGSEGRKGRKERKDGYLIKRCPPKEGRKEGRKKRKEEKEGRKEGKE